MQTMIVPVLQIVLLLLVLRLSGSRTVSKVKLVSSLVIVEHYLVVVVTLNESIGLPNEAFYVWMAEI